MKRYESWGKYPTAHHKIYPLQWRTDKLDMATFDRTVLPFGQGRSYGDSCLNDGGILLDTEGLNRLISFDREKGILRCEAGLTLDKILELIVPQGWFFPVTPGTKYVSVGGCIANDVHGKTHHREGTFGHHVSCFELMRSNGERLLCSPTENEELFRATIGGLGLTGLITWAELTLKPIKSPFIRMESIKFENLDKFFEVSAESDEKFEATMAWVDCLSQGESLGRGIFMGGNFAEPPFDKTPTGRSKTLFTVPINAPNFALNTLTSRAFNYLYYNKQRIKIQRSLLYYEPFFYPLDILDQWNRIYGNRGFMQYQFVVPYTDYNAIRTIFQKIAESGLGSFLAVLKTFGDIPSLGIMSFPRQGVNLALDFPNDGTKTFNLLEQLDQIVKANNGLVYPAKDARMSADSFQSFYPQWHEFAKYIDPKFSSSFWRRVTVSK